MTGRWRGIAEVRDGNLDLEPELAHLDARRRFTIDTAPVRDDAAEEAAKGCICGAIMLGLANPGNCALFGKTCVPSRRWAPAWCRPRGSAASGTPTAASRSQEGGD